MGVWLPSCQVEALTGVKAASRNPYVRGEYAALAKSISEPAEHVAKKGLSQKAAPAIVKLIAQVESQFSLVVSEKAAALAVPVVGAFGGAVINSLFIDHFQDMGRGNFTIRRLERLHGQEEVRRLYGEL